MIQLLDLLFPPRCVGCKLIGSYICQNCQLTIRFRSPLCPECDQPAIDGITHPKCLHAHGLDGLISMCRYIEVVKKAIKELKYRWVADLAKDLIELIPKDYFHYLPFDSTWVIYPIPLHAKRQKWRGFNQAEELAKYLGQRLKLDLVTGLLIRTEVRTPQADLSKREQRIKNARGLFKINKKSLPKKIILFDDVWTTGGTMKEAGKVLKRNGVEKLWGMTIAR